LDIVQIIMSTKEKIVSKALQMFNERGIEYVGLRELAALLDMRVSNITYYFPTKDDLVNQLSLDLNLLNSVVVVPNQSISIYSFLEMLKAVFYNQVKYRCLLLSFVHLMEQNKVMAKRYQQTQENRNSALRLNLETLVKSGYIKPIGKIEIEFLGSTLALIIRFWISEAAVSYKSLTTNQQIAHYIMLIINLLLPYSTDKSKSDFERFMAELMLTVEQEK